MSERRVRVEVDDAGVATLSLARPEKRNALDDLAVDALIGAVDSLAADRSVRVVVLRGDGPSFCAGADVSGAGSPPPRGALEDRDHMLEERFGRFVALWDAPQPVIAAVQGHCLGIAVALCSCADLVVVADDASIGWPLPLGGGVIGPAFALHVGMRRAKELSFLPMSTLTGVEAAAIGWANRSVPAADLDGEVAAMAARMAAVPSGVLRVKKAAINAVFDRIGFREAVRGAATANALAHTDPEVEDLRAVVRREGMGGAARHLRG